MLQGLNEGAVCMYRAYDKVHFLMAQRLGPVKMTPGLLFLSHLMQLTCLQTRESTVPEDTDNVFFFTGAFKPGTPGMLVLFLVFIGYQGAVKRQTCKTYTRQSTSNDCNGMVLLPCAQVI